MCACQHIKVAFASATRGHQSSSLPGTMPPKNAGNGRGKGTRGRGRGGGQPAKGTGRGKGHWRPLARGNADDEGWARFYIDPVATPPPPAVPPRAELQARMDEFQELIIEHLGAMMACAARWADAVEDGRPVSVVAHALYIERGRCQVYSHLDQFMDLVASITASDLLSPEGQGFLDERYLEAATEMARQSMTARVTDLLRRRRALQPQGPRVDDPLVGTDEPEPHPQDTDDNAQMGTAASSSAGIFPP